MSVVIVVDAANVVGARPDGWWRDRHGANARLVARLAGLAERGAPRAAFDDRRDGAGDEDADAGPVAGADAVLRPDVEVVVEGRAAGVEAPVPGTGGSVRVVRATRDGDATVVERAEALAAGRVGVLVVTADRGLIARLDPAVRVRGPRWLLELLDGS
jgi:8-oxo-dGTP diphosphatase